MPKEQYQIRQNLLGPEEPLDIDCLFPLLGDHSRSRLQSVDVRLVGTHARLSESIRLVELARDIAPEVLPDLDFKVPRYLPKTPISSFPVATEVPSTTCDFFYRAVFSVWRLFPSMIRAAGYDILRYFGRPLYGQPVGLVQQLPFGLYLRYQGDQDEFRNEYNGLQTVLQHTSVRLLDPLIIFRVGRGPTTKNAIMPIFS